MDDEWLLIERDGDIALWKNTNNNKWKVTDDKRSRPCTITYCEPLARSIYKDNVWWENHKDEDIKWSGPPDGTPMVGSGGRWTGD